MNKASKNTCIVCGSEMGTFIEKISDDRYGYPQEYSIEQCNSCGQMRTWPPLLEADLAPLYSNHYPRKTVDFVALEREANMVKNKGDGLRRWLSGTDNQGHYRAFPGEKVLDIGCGSCLSLLEMRNLGITAFGVEADPNVRTIADRYSFKVHIGNLMENPFPGEQFDLVVLNQVVEHVPDPAILLETVRGRLKSGGRVALSFPNANSWQRRLSGVKWINWHVPYHQHHFNLESFQSLATQHGYLTEKSRTITPNLWSILQAYSIFQAHEKSAGTSIWKSNSATSTPPSFFRNIKNISKSILLKILMVVIMVHNRLVDALGYGDSIFIVLKSTHQSK
jgi:2-polyprenyl-3-methyl-5-hydroxy-6-metoxy-1,4-benzoquinol methylase